MDAKYFCILKILLERSKIFKKKMEGEEIEKIYSKCKFEN